MIYNIILIVLFAVQTIALLIITIVRNREIDKEIECCDCIIEKFKNNKENKKNEI